MRLHKFREYLETEAPDAILFEDPAYDLSAIGISTDGRVVYDFDKMVEELMSDDHMDSNERADFVSYDTIRALDYLTRPEKPIVVFNLDMEEFV